MSHLVEFSLTSVGAKLVVVTRYLPKIYYHYYRLGGRKTNILSRRLEGASIKRKIYGLDIFLAASLLFLGPASDEKNKYKVAARKFRQISTARAQQSSRGLVEEIKNVAETVKS